MSISVFVWHSPPIFLSFSFRYINLSLLVSRCYCIYHFIHGRGMLSLDDNRSKDKGTITITTYMSFLSVLYKFAFTLLHFYFPSCFLCVVHIDNDIDETAGGHHTYTYRATARHRSLYQYRCEFTNVDLTTLNTLSYHSKAHDHSPFLPPQDTEGNNTNSAAANERGLCSE